MKDVSKRNPDSYGACKKYVVQMQKTFDVLKLFKEYKQAKALKV
jgi:hypothetical protein